MVKLKIREEDRAKEEVDKVPELEFYLEVDASGNLILHAVANGFEDGWEILYITPEGKYTLAVGLDGSIGLQVTKEGRIKRGTL